MSATVWSVARHRADNRGSIGSSADIPGINPVEQSVHFVLYGVAITGIGMLTLTGNNVAMDSFGPIADNANGIG